MFEWFANPEAWAALATLTVLEIVLGIDNIIFLTILVGRLPKSQQAFARTTGLGLAMLTRLALLFSLSWVMKLTEPLITLMGHGISGRDIILIGGGLFLMIKAVSEIYECVVGGESELEVKSGADKLWLILLQIAVLDIVFSLDSVITAVGLVSQVSLMAIAIILAVGVMLFAAKGIGDFVDNHPSIKVLALSFLVIVGVTLIAEGFDVHVPKGYIYFAMAFSFVVEMINIKMRKNLQSK